MPLSLGRSRATAIPCLGAITVLALAGCGASNPRNTPSKAQFIARADAICGDEAAKLSRVDARDQGSGAPLGQVPRLIRQVVVIREAATARLESLSQPAGESTSIARWLTARTVAATFEYDTAEAPRSQGSVAASDIRAALRKATARVRDLSASYGFRVCGASE
jgi:hypothetical protein